MGDFSIFAIWRVSLLLSLLVWRAAASGAGIPLTRTKCSIPRLCDSYQSYTFPTINRTELFIHLEEIPLTTMCIMLEETSLNPIDSSLESKYPRYLRQNHSLKGKSQASSFKKLDANQADFYQDLGPVYVNANGQNANPILQSRIESKFRSKLICYEQVIEQNYILLSLPLTLKKGQYVILIYAFDHQKGFHLIQQQYQYVVPAMPRTKTYEDSPIVKIISPGYGALQYEEILIHLFNSFEKQEVSRNSAESASESQSSSSSSANQLIKANLNSVKDNSMLCLHVHSYQQQHLLPDTTAVTTKGSDIIFEPASTFFQFIPMKYFGNEHEQLHVPTDEEITIRHVPMTYFPELEIERQIVSALQNRDDYKDNSKGSPSNWKAGRYDQGYIEVVLSDERLAEQRFFATIWNEVTQAIEWNPEIFSKDFPHVLTSKHRGIDQNFQRDYSEMLRSHVKRYFGNKKYYQEKIGFKTKQPVKGQRSDGKKINICIPVGNEMDGQKQIWLQQVEHLNKDRFNFIFFLTFESISKKQERLDEQTKTSEGRNNGPIAFAQTINPMTLTEETKTSQTSFYHYLMEQVEKDKLLRKGQTNIFMADNSANAYAIPEEEIIESPVEINEVFVNPETGISSTSQKMVKLGSIWHHNLTLITEYAHQRYLLADGDISAMTPQWSKTLYQYFVNDFTKYGCDLITMANNKGYSADVSLVDVSNYLNIPIIAELTNLHIHPDSTPDVVIAPSHQSLFHETVQTAFQQMEMQSGFKPLGIVISPSVDISKYDPSKFRTVPATVAAKSCEVFNPLGTVRKEVPYNVFMNGFYKHRPCVLIGFSARLVPGKNPGLFVQAAYLILQTYPFARFRFIGEGPIKEDLMALAQRLSIDHAIDFIGWVPNSELPQYLADLDILVNPSLRGWAETFCISNIEAMSMEIPVVTFAVGGIGEYVVRPNNSSTPSSKLWDITHNAIVVNSADPVALCGAILELIHHPFLARQMGRNARKSLTDYFHTVRQITQYESLYEELTKPHW